MLNTIIATVTENILSATDRDSGQYVGSIEINPVDFATPNNSCISILNRLQAVVDAMREMTGATIQSVTANADDTGFIVLVR